MPDLPLYLLQVLLLPDALYYVCEILHFYLLRMSRGLTRQMTSPSPQSQDDRNGKFNKASKFSLSGNVLIDNNANNASININSSNKFMAELLQETIPGAAFDSSARDPPPRCHPKTRLAILEQCVVFIATCTGQRKMRWVFGAAGVGKSAIMQSVAEYHLVSITLRASIFFLVNGRSDGSKAIVTLAYQLAVQCEPYCQFIKQEIARDPSLLQKSVSVQFDKFIIEPFIHRPHLNGAGRVLIIIDGLDECDQSRLQRELLRLISDFCLAYPSSPIVWIIASRPEPHITSFFAQASVEVAYEKEEIPVDSNEAREDVEKFLRMELLEIQNEFLLPSEAQWPSEEDFWKLANAAGGLFVFAQTVVKYIGDPHNGDHGDPTARLKNVMRVIDAHPHEEHPVALLDALYALILSKVPTQFMKNARKLLLALVIDWEQFCDPRGRKFVVLCNWLGMTCDEAYAAIGDLSSVLYLSRNRERDMTQLRCFHKSFLDYLSDFTRSGFSSNIKRDAHQVFFPCTLRILEQVPDGIAVFDFDYTFADKFFHKTTLARGPGTGDYISLTWPVGKGSGWRDDMIRFCMYKIVFSYVMEGLWLGQQAFCSVFFIRHLAARLKLLPSFAPQTLSSVVFDQSRRREFIEQGLLQQIPIKVLNSRDIVSTLQLHFRHSTTPDTNLSNPWNSSCTHGRSGTWEEGEDLDWSTTIVLWEIEIGYICDFCYQRFEDQLENWKARLPEYPVTVLFTSAGVGLIELHFVDLEDGISEWTYRFGHRFSKEERKKLGSTV